MIAAPGKRLSQSREAKIAAEVARLRAVGYGTHCVERKNGQLLSIEEAAANNVDNAAKYAANRRAMGQARRAPGAQTDREFFAGLNLHKQYEHEKVKYDEIIEGAHRHGYNPTGDEVYQEGFELGVADVGNPAYFISEKNGGRSQLKKLRKSRGLKEALY